MDVAITPREAVLQYGLLPINVILPQLDSISSLYGLVGSLSAAAVTDANGQRVISVSDAADALSIDQQQCQLLLDTLAAVSLAPPPPTQPPCSSAAVHDLALFLLAQLYGRDSHKIETQDHWPEPAATASMRAAAAATAGPAGSPLVNAQASRLLIKNQLLQQQKQHQAYARGYAEFLQRHHRTMLEFVLDDPAPLRQWRQQREARKQQKEQQQQPVPPDKQPSTAAAAVAGAAGAAAPPAEQQQQQAAGPSDVVMSPVDSMQVDAATGTPAEPAAASQPAAAAAAAGAVDGPKDMVLEANASDSPVSLAAAAAGSVASRSTGSLVSLQSTLGRTSSLPALMVSSKEMDRLSLLLHVSQGEGSAHGGLFYSVGGAAAGSEGGAAAQQQQPQSANGSSTSAGGAPSSKGPQPLSSIMPGMREQQGALLEEVVGWLGSNSQAPWQMQTLAGYGSLLRATSAGSALAGVVGGGSSGGAHAPGTLICADQSAVSAWLYGPGEQEAAAAAAAAASAQTSSSSPAAAAAAVLASGAGTSSGGGAGEGAAAAAGAGGVPPPALALGAISPLTQPSPGPEGTLSPMPSLGGASPFSLGPPAVPAVEGFGDVVTPLAQLQTQQPQQNPGGSCLALSGSSPTPGTPNGHLSPAVQQQLQLGLVAPVLSPVRTRLSPAAAAPGGGGSSGGGAVSSGGATGHLAGTMRVNARGMTAVAGGILDHRGIQSVYRGSVVQGPSDVEPNAEMLIQDCTECHIYVLAPLRRVCVSNCSDCTVILGAVGTLLRLENCERLQLVAAAGQVQVVSCHSCTLYLGTIKPPVLLGDCRFVTLAPHNTRYEFIQEHMAAAGLPTGVASLWNQPIVVSNTREGCVRKPCGATPSSPLTHGSGGARGGGSSGPKPMLLMAPEDFLPLVVPFRGGPGPLAGGVAASLSSQWTRGTHKQQTGPLPPWPFLLPPAYDAALESKYAVVTELKGRIKGSGLDDVRRNQLQNIIQAFFREWLHSSGHIRAVYDLQKMESDEGHPGGGSPTHHL